jgi:hypothetical protein
MVDCCWLMGGMGVRLRGAYGVIFAALRGELMVVAPRSAG